MNEFGPVDSSPSLSVIVFAYNEAQNLKVFLPQLQRWTSTFGPGAEIVFVNDGSSDESLTVAQSLLGATPCKSHNTNSGIGAAIKTGVRHARGSWITFLPADGQIEPDALDILWREKERTQADVVFSVYKDRNDGLDRKVYSWGVRAIIKALFGVNMKSDGPYLFKKAVFHPEALPSNTFFLNFEFPILALRQKLNTSCVTLSCKPRLSGVSKSTGFKRIMMVGKELVAFRLR